VGFLAQPNLTGPSFFFFFNLRLSLTGSRSQVFQELLELT
jgi:hypothetical protein